jgi:hypothetical protein
LVNHLKNEKKIKRENKKRKDQIPISSHLNDILSIATKIHARKNVLSLTTYIKGQEIERSDDQLQHQT